MSFSLNYTFENFKCFFWRVVNFFVYCKWCETQLCLRVLCCVIEVSNWGDYFLRLASVIKSIIRLSATFVWLELFSLLEGVIMQVIALLCLT